MEEPGGGLSSMPIGEGHLVAVVNEASPLAGAHSVTTARLAEERLLRWTRESNPMLFDAVLPDMTAVETVEGVAQATGIDNLLARVVAGNGVGIMLDSTARQYPVPGVAYVPIEALEPMVRRLVWHTDNGSSLLARLIDALRERDLTA